MAHSHGHDRSTYYIEQLCILTICGLLGGVSVLLYYQQKLLMLAPNRHFVVLLGGIALLVFVALRAITLWRSVGRPSPAPLHDHLNCHDEHDCLDEHDHDHAHHHVCDHDHHHEHAHAHDHGHDHAHDHGHDHGHGHDHDHTWNPGRYIVLLLPIVLYFLDLPNAGFSAGFSGVSGISVHDDPSAVDARYVENTGMQIARGTSDRIQVARVIGDSPADKAGVKPGDALLQLTRDENGEGKPLQQSQVVSLKGKSLEEAVKDLRGKAATKLNLTVQHAGDETPKVIEIVRAEDVLPLGFKALEGAAFLPDRRQYYDGRLVKLTGQFAPARDTNRMFSLVRYKITCCAADAVPLNVLIMLDPQSKESLSSFQANDWVEVKGRVQFRKRRDRDEYITVLLVSALNDIQKTPADPSPFLQ